MGLFDYLFACGFWQWFGTIILAAVVLENAAKVVKHLCDRSRP